MFTMLKCGFTTKILCSGTAKELCKVLAKSNINNYQVATLTRAAFRNEEEVPNIKPFPYHEKEFGLFNMMFFDTYKCRVHKHTKLIVIDGPVAAGKDNLAKELAKEFDFLYLPQPRFDEYYRTPWGFDIRSLDCKLPKSVQTWDIERFLQNPHDENTAVMQMSMSLMRQKTYMEALAHIFCTGQGVVTVRSPWSDIVFSKAMQRSGYISKGALEACMDSYDASLYLYLKPHLIIYLDVTVENTLKNIRKSDWACEVNSKVLNTKYLEDIENSYKHDYLTEMNKHCELLIYDWTQGSDVEAVVDEIEKINFDDYEGKHPKLEDWKLEQYIWKVHAKHYTDDADLYLRHNFIFRTDVPELLASGNDAEEYHNVTKNIPDLKYAEGYNILKGDKGIFMKTKSVITKDRVTPLMKKYYERKAKEKRKLSSA